MHVLPGATFGAGDVEESAPWEVSLLTLVREGILVHKNGVECVRDQDGVIKPGRKATLHRRAPA